MKELKGLVSTETIALYSKTCTEYLTQALKKAESSIECDFRRFFEAPKELSVVHNWSSDEEGGNEWRSSEDDQSESEDELSDAVTRSPSPVQTQMAVVPQECQPSKQEQGRVLNEKEKESAIRRMDKPSYIGIPLAEPDNFVIQIPVALLSKEQRLSNMFEQCQAFYRLSNDLAIMEKPTIVILLRSGRFAGGIFIGPKCLQHKTTSRYTIRKGQGKAQSTQDGKRKPKSVGSQLRRAGEEALRQDVKLFLQQHKSYVQTSCLVLISCPKVMMKNFFEDNDNIIRRGDDRIRRVPLDFGRPTFEAVVGVFEVMMRVNIVPENQNKNDKPKLQAVNVSEPLDSIPEKQDIPEPEKVKTIEPLTRLHEIAATANLAELIQYLDTQPDFNVDQEGGPDLLTPLHVAADSSNNVDPTAAAACVTALLVQGNANPCVRDSRGRVPYFLATHLKVREAFRIARATLGEDYCNWENAKVGPPLTVDDLQAAKEKAAEKKRRQRARQKEKHQREVAQMEEARKLQKEEEERRKQEEDAKRARDGLQPKDSSAAGNVCDFCQKVSKGKRRSQMLQRLNYAYCSTECVQNHKRELMAAAALARFG